MWRIILGRVFLTNTTALPSLPKFGSNSWVAQGGKGRTGVFISAFLLWSGHRRTALDALELFTFRRSENYKPEVRAFRRFCSSQCRRIYRLNMMQSRVVLCSAHLLPVSMPAQLGLDSSLSHGIAIKQCNQTVEGPSQIRYG